MNDIRSLQPVTLTRDARVTNYSFEDGRAVGFQSILEAGTAVLVDRYGEPVARCRCGNPLSKPIFYAKATGVGKPIVYLGSKTGRDGIHGASMASAEFGAD